MEELADLVANRYGGALKGEHGTGRNMAPFVETEWGPEAVAVDRWLGSRNSQTRTLSSIPASSSTRGPRRTSSISSRPRRWSPRPIGASSAATASRCARAGTSRSPRRGSGSSCAGRYCGSGPSAIPRRCSPRLSATMTTMRCKPARVMACASWPARSASTRARWSGGSATMATQRERRGPRARSPGPGRLPSASPAAPCAPAARPPRRPATGYSSRSPGLPARSATTSWCPAGWNRRPQPRPPSFRPPHATARPPSTSRPASIASSALTAASRRTRPCRKPSSQSRNGPGCRYGSPPTSPGRAARRPGTPRGTKTATPSWPTGPWSGRTGGPKAAWLALVTDASSCAYGLHGTRPYLTPQNQRRFDALTLLDSVDFAHDRLLPRLTVPRTVASVALHPVCSLHHAGTEDKLRAIAAAIADEVFVPPSAGCCGFAGDCGFLHPELTASATAPMAASSPGASAPPTCPATAPARSACNAAPASRTAPSCSCSRNSHANARNAQRHLLKKDMYPRRRQKRSTGSRSAPTRHLEMEQGPGDGDVLGVYRRVVPRRGRDS